MNVSHSTSSFPSAVQGLGRQAAEAVDSIGAATHDEAVRLGQATRDYAHRAAATARDMASTVKQEAAVVNHKAQRYVRDEPVKAIVIAAAAGVALASLMLMALRRKS